MRIILKLKDAGDEDEFRPLVEAAAQKLRKHLWSVANDLLDLHVHMERSRHHGGYDASLTLHLPSGTLNSKGQGPAPAVCLKDGVRDLLDQVHRLKSRWKGEHHRKREGESFRGEAALAAAIAQVQYRDQEL
jgi:ribosome-associated translation inhibitor RaiA